MRFKTFYSLAILFCTFAFCIKAYAGQEPIELRTETKITLNEKLKQCLILSTTQDANFKELQIVNNALLLKTTDLEQSLTQSQDEIAKRDENIDKLNTEKEDLQKELDDIKRSSNYALGLLALSAAFAGLAALFRSKTIHFQAINYLKGAKIAGILALVFLCLFFTSLGLAVYFLVAP